MEPSIPTYNGLLVLVGWQALVAGRGMLYKLGRFLQLIGLIVPLVGVSGNLARPDEINLKVMLMIAAIGIGIFYLGRAIQSWGGSPP
jgi:hypothetical protein